MCNGRACNGNFACICAEMKILCSISGGLSESMGLEALWLTWCRAALRLCRCDDGLSDELRWQQQQQRRAPPLVCYYSLSDELVKRQLEFRKTRRVERNASYSSLSSLATVSEDLEHPETLAMESALRGKLQRNSSMPADIGWMRARSPPYPVEAGR